MPDIRYAVDDPVALITLDRPDKLNRIDAKEGAAALLERRSPSFPRLGA